MPFARRSGVGDPLDLQGIGRVGTRLVVRRTSGDEVVDLNRVASVREEGTILYLADDGGRRVRIELDSPAVRADVLARVIEWCDPVLGPMTAGIARRGIELRSDDPPLRAELARLVVELTVAAATAILLRQLVVTIAAGLFALLRIASRMRRASTAPAPIRFVPAPEGLFPRLREGDCSIDLRDAVFDPGEWASGAAVVTDGTRSIRVPIGEREGAFALFATLVGWCPTPDERITD